MIDGYIEWLDRQARIRSSSSVNAYVRLQMPDESETVRSNVGDALYERAKARARGESKANAPSDDSDSSDPLAGSW
jgi:hypothetical protein